MIGSDIDLTTSTLATNGLGAVPQASGAHLEGLVVVPVHVPDEEVQHGHVGEVQQPAPVGVRVHLLHQLAVVPVC